jgi:uncharacterized paraquat-inducible protein A
MPLAVYEILTRNGEVVGEAEMDPAFADRFSTLRRKRGKLAQAREYLKAEASKLLQGALPTEMVRKRLEACRSCEWREVTPQGEHCRRCGCGRRRRAELTIKATMPAATCPLGKW